MYARPHGRVVGEEPSNAKEKIPRQIIIKKVYSD